MSALHRSQLNRGRLTSEQTTTLQPGEHSQRGNRWSLTSRGSAKGSLSDPKSTAIAATAGQIQQHSSSPHCTQTATPSS